MTLSDWLERGWLVTHRPDLREIKHLLGIADRDIADSPVEGISADTRLSLAYSASNLGAAGCATAYTAKVPFATANFSGDAATI